MKNTIGKKAERKGMILRSGSSDEVTQGAGGNAVLCIVDINIKGGKKVMVTALKGVFGGIAKKVSEFCDRLCRHRKRRSCGLSIVYIHVDKGEIVSNTEIKNYLVNGSYVC